MIKCNLWSNLPQNVLDLVKTSIFYAPLKSSLEWFATAHKGVWVESGFDVKSRTNFVKFSLRGLQNYKCFQIFCTIFLQCTRSVYLKNAKQGKSEIRVSDLMSHAALEPCPVKLGRETKDFDVLWSAINIQGFNQNKKNVVAHYSKNYVFYILEQITESKQRRKKSKLMTLETKVSRSVI